MFYNGDTFTGEYFHGKPEGKGIFQWANGSVYNG